MVQQDVHEVTRLVHSLEAASGKKKQLGKKTFSCKKSTFPVSGSDISVDSWRFQDWDYKRDDLPTYARGLFTTRNEKNQYEIAIRGYDKFFNVDEVNLTRWRNIEHNTRGPYELSVKENGCIIFISGLEDGTLLVCSKHSTGARTDVTLSHAVAGENWAKRHVAAVGRTMADLAKALRKANLTAVGELCDDRFEEHVLPYDEEASGIYLHGLNYNVPEFATLPSLEVHKFADEWGFKKAQFLMKDSLSEVKAFLEKCAETGSWDGRDTEGFVIRCQLSEGGVGPYRDWFFKYKFEEPYLMYRQWREATKAIIAGRQPKIKKHVAITEQYLQYARRQLAQDPKLAKLYNQNHGIISMRDGFLKERGMKGSDIIAMELAQGEGTSPLAKVTQDIVLVPVASIGCGKTTLALALVKLFGWGHIQNDNIQGPKNRPKRFAQEVTSSLATHGVVIADRNNHQKRERSQIIDDVLRVVPNAKFVALHYVHEPKQLLLHDIRKVTQARVLERGDNHQTIQAGSKDRDSVIGIMEGFLSRFEAVDTNLYPDDGFDEVIDLDVTTSSRENLEKVVSALHSSFPKLMEGKMPTSSDLDNAIDEAMKNYKVDTKHDLKFSNSNKFSKQTAPRESPDQLAKRIEYFNISLNSNQITTLLASLFSSSTIPPERRKLYSHLKNSRRIQTSFHVTLIHRASQKTHPDIWAYYTNLYKAAIQKEQPNPANGYVLETPILGTTRVRIERLVWDDRIMAFVARICPREGDSWPCANDIPHITVGTAAPEVKPKESNDLLKRWLEVGAGAETGIWEAEVPSVTMLEGSVGEVLMK
ncbi:tRNA ligase [Histoplasma capsulatum G186AR]|uniref:tRNA ligase n=1 Tax=Ajellomyces capsulatus (strain G186AR / H82 / ATCC MYA-2454 / RMSCC 2432) TaxID=447093 RepID=C0NJJ2_AJECG|nr:tRNA ligase [Histoplasma capsulatum G186AR]EEH08033.1 tRNA ligase [Histoplasma capsulatum G186AR]